MSATEYLPELHLSTCSTSMRLQYTAHLYIPVERWEGEREGERWREG